MIYRPQFVFSTPPGFRDEQFHYSFDSSNVPILGTAILAGQSVNNIALQLQNDAEFILRALKIQLGTAVSNLNIQLKDPYGDYLSTGSLPIANMFSGSGRSIVGRLFIPYEPEIRCPAGSTLQIASLTNLTTGSVLPPAFTFYGVKRYRECAA